MPSHRHHPRHPLVDGSYREVSLGAAAGSRADAIGELVADDLDRYEGLGIFRVFLKLPKRIQDILDTYEKIVDRETGVSAFRVKQLAKSLARLIPKQLKKRPKWKIPDLAIELLEEGGQEEYAMELEDLMDAREDAASLSSSSSPEVDDLASAVKKKISDGDKSGAKAAGRKLAEAVEAAMEADDSYEPSAAVYDALEKSGISAEVFGAMPRQPGHDTAHNFLMELAGRSPHLHSRPYSIDGVWIVPSQVAALSRHRVKGWLRGYMEKGQIEPGVSAGIYRLGDHFHVIFGMPEEVRALLSRLPASNVISYVPPLRGHTRTMSHAELEGTHLGFGRGSGTSCLQLFSQDPTRPEPGSLDAAIFAGVSEAFT